VTLLPKLQWALMALQLPSLGWVLPEPTKRLLQVLLVEVTSESSGSGPLLDRWQQLGLGAAVIAALLPSAPPPMRQLTGKLPVVKEFE